MEKVRENINHNFLKKILLIIFLSLDSNDFSNSFKKDILIKNKSAYDRKKSDFDMYYKSAFAKSVFKYIHGVNYNKNFLNNNEYFMKMWLIGVEEWLKKYKTFDLYLKDMKESNPLYKIQERQVRKIYKEFKERWATPDKVMVEKYLDIVHEYNQRLDEYFKNMLGFNK